MSADKYAQFIAEQQRKLSVSGVNAVDLQEKKQMSKADIAKLREPKDDIDADDLEALRNKEHLKKEEVEQLDELEKETLASYAAAAGKSGGKASIRASLGDKKAKNTLRKRMKGFELLQKKAERGELGEALDHYGVNRKKITDRHIQAAYHGMSDNEKEFHKAMGVTKNMSSDHPKYVKSKEKFNKIRKLPDDATIGHAIKILQEEAEQVDEIRAIKGVHATRMRKAPSITPSKVRYKGKGSKPKVQTDLNITASYEISADESAYLEEMVGKGKLNDILMHHKDNMRHHEKMLNHHMVQADKAEEVGDERGFDHHTGEAIHHEMQAQHHQIRFDHASGLKARANAQREMKAAQSAMKSASEKIAAAKQDKRDWG
jgi:hypothetical protein